MLRNQEKNSVVRGIFLKGGGILQTSKMNIVPAMCLEFMWPPSAWSHK